MQSRNLIIMNILNKYIWLIDTLSRAGLAGLSFDEISDKYTKSDFISGGGNYNIRTFHNHRRDIKEIFHIDIECHLDTYRYYIADNQSIRNTTSVRKWLLESISLNNLLAENEKIRDRIILEDVPSSEPNLTLCLQAIQENRKVSFQYTRFQKRDELYYKDFMPVCLKMYKRRWYLYGGHTLERCKIYALDRMSDMTIQADTFVIPEDYNPSEYFEGFFGVYLDERVEPQVIELKVDAVSAKYLRSLPLHVSQEEVTATEKYSIFRLYLRPTQDFIHELLTYDNKIEILKPKSLRAQIKSTLQNMASLYEES